MKIAFLLFILPLAGGGGLEAAIAETARAESQFVEIQLLTGRRLSGHLLAHQNDSLRLARATAEGSVEETVGIPEVEKILVPKLQEPATAPELVLLFEDLQALLSFLPSGDLARLEVVPAELLRDGAAGKALGACSLLLEAAAQNGRPFAEGHFDLTAMEANLHLGLTARAERIADAMIARDPNSPRAYAAWRVRAQIARERGDYKRCLRSALRPVLFAPESLQESADLLRCRELAIASAEALGLPIPRRPHRTILTEPEHVHDTTASTSAPPPGALLRDQPVPAPSPRTGVKH